MSVNGWHEILSLVATGLTCMYANKAVGSHSSHLIVQHVCMVHLQEDPAQLEVEPGALAGKTVLQHLVIKNCTISGGTIGIAQLLIHMRPMQQLTHLCLEGSLQEVEWWSSTPPASESGDQEDSSESTEDEQTLLPDGGASSQDTPRSPAGNQGTNPSTAPEPGGEWDSEGVWDSEGFSTSEGEWESSDKAGAESVYPLAAAYAALTASSKLQHLGLRKCVLPAGVWHHMLRAGRQLQHITSLDISHVQQAPPDEDAPAPEGTVLVSCCPGLQELHMQGLQDSAQQLPALQGLSGLTKLAMNADESTAADGLCQLTGLKDLFVWDCNIGQGLHMQLTGLKELTRLYYRGLVTNDDRQFGKLKLIQKVGHLLDVCLPRGLHVAVVVPSMVVMAWYLAATVSN